MCVSLIPGLFHTVLGQRKMLILKGFKKMGLLAEFSNLALVYLWKRVGLLPQCTQLLLLDRVVFYVILKSPVYMSK